MTTRNLVLLAALGAVVIVLPTRLSTYHQHILVLIALFGTLALAWNILGGMAGQISIGHSLFMGVGAYTSTAFHLWWGVSPWCGLVAGTLLGSLLGAVIGYVVFRLRLSGIYFALVTLAIAEMGYYVVSGIGVLGAANGLYIPPDYSALSFQFESKTPYVYIAFALLAGAVCVTLAIEHSRLGFALAAIRENERAAAALGIDPVGSKVVAAALSGGLAATVGTFYAQYVLFVDPDTVLGTSISVEALMYAFIGGIHHVFGPLLGAIVLVPLAEAMRTLLGNRFAGGHLIAYGVILILVIRVAPNGLAGLLGSLARTRLRGL